MVEFASGSSRYKVVNTVEALTRLRNGLLRGPGKNRNAGGKAGPGAGAETGAAAEAGPSLHERAEQAARDRAEGREAQFRAFLDTLSERQLKNFGYDGEFVKYAPGVTLPRNTAEALKAAKAAPAFGYSNFFTDSVVEAGRLVILLLLSL
jgi:hypothetical protein